MTPRPPFSWTSSCCGKEKHKTIGKAKAHVRSLKAKVGEQSGRPIIAYKCLWCGFYHVGHERRRPQARP